MVSGSGTNSPGLVFFAKYRNVDIPFRVGLQIIEQQVEFIDVAERLLYSLGSFKSMPAVPSLLFNLPMASFRSPMVVFNVVNVFQDPAG